MDHRLPKLPVKQDLSQEVMWRLVVTGRCHGHCAFHKANARNHGRKELEELKGSFPRCRS